MDLCERKLAAAYIRRLASTTGPHDRWGLALTVLADAVGAGVHVTNGGTFADSRGTAADCCESTQTLERDSPRGWLLFFTNKGRTYRTDIRQFCEAFRVETGAPSSDLVALQPYERIVRVLHIADYSASPYLGIATADGQVKKARLADFDSSRKGGIIAINLAERDELVDASLITSRDTLLLTTRQGSMVRIGTDDNNLHPMGRATPGVQWVSLGIDDRVVSMSVL